MTLALAPASLTHVLTLLQRKADGTPHIVPQPGFAQTQGKMIAWANRNWADVVTLKGAIASVSGDHRRLNAFLRRHEELRPRFEPIKHGHIGIASVFKASVKLAEPATNTTVSRVDEHDELELYRGFELPAKSVEFFHVLNPGEQPLVRIPLEGGYCAWVVKTDKPTDVFWAIDEAEYFVTKVTMMEELAKVGPRTEAPRREPQFSSVRIPAIEIHQSTELDWLEGLQVGRRTVARAFQSFRVETPSLPRAAKSLVQPLATLDQEGPLQFCDPFLLIITENNVPIGVVYAGTDCWERIG